ncbi:MAG TPA: fused MFS/spermidine synthase [Pyrinomonadaceae bacterium]|nr:fused MFS/spermidine synthase [Pyrinomonadaceae bacterium]
MEQEQKKPPVPGLILEVTVFTCGALVMAYEIIGSRIVAPYIGASTYIWTSLIGVILAALSLGYWIGGRMADRRPDVKVLAAAIFAAGGLVALTILAKDVLLAFTAASPLPLELKAVAASLLLFAPAAAALGFVLPYAAKLRIASIDTAGNTVGRLYALSTVGSIVGTFAAGFFMIPQVGSVRSLYLIAGLLFVLSVLLTPFVFSRLNFGVLILFVLAMAGNEFTAYQLRTSAGMIDADTEYSRVRIFQTEDRTTGRPIRVLSTDPYSAQSATFLDGGDELVLEYTKFYHLVSHFRPGHRDALMIGGAGFSFPREHLRTYPDAEITVVEIDPQMAEFAREYFDLPHDPRLRIVHQDGRIYLNSAAPEMFDAVLVDAFGSLLTVPIHLTTVEAVQAMERTLRPNGVVILNIGSAITGSRSGFLQAELATYRRVFPEVRVFKVRPERGNDEIQNLIVVARKETETPAGPVDENDVPRMLATEIDVPPSDAVPLTDDHAPVERFSAFAY